MSLLLKECEWCGNQFVPTHFNVVYCSENCRHESVKDRQKRGRVPSGYRRTKGLEAGVPTIPDMVSATMEHNKRGGKPISYGQMVSIMERGNF